MENSGPRTHDAFATGVDDAMTVPAMRGGKGRPGIGSHVINCLSLGRVS